MVNESKEEGLVLFNNEHVVYDFDGCPRFSSLSPIRQRELGRVNNEVLLFYGDSFNLSDMRKVFTRVDLPSHSHI